MSAAQQLAEYENYVESSRPTREKPRQFNVLGCGSTCAKRFLLAINLVFLALGAALVGFGAYALNSNALGLTSKALPTAALALGVFVLVVSVLGCCGAAQENRCILFLYVAVLSILVVAQLVVGGLVLADRDNADKLLGEGWDSAGNDGRVDLQNEFSCCGFETETDNPGVPCPDTFDGPCLPALRDEFNDRLVVIGAIALALAFFEVSGLVLACCLRKGIASARFETGDDQLEDARRVNRRQY